MDGASRMSSVFGLNDSPQKATVLLEARTEVGVDFIEQHTLLIVVHCLNASRIRMVCPFSRPVRAKAFTSFGKQEPPYPIPG